MKERIIFSIIKTPCGRAKYKELSSREGILASIRLMWFIIIATIKDLNIAKPKENQSED